MSAIGSHLFIDICRRSADCKPKAQDTHSRESVPHRKEYANLQLARGSDTHFVLLCAVATAGHVEKLSVQAKRNRWGTVIQRSTDRETNRQAGSQRRASAQQQAQARRQDRLYAERRLVTF